MRDATRFGACGWNGLGSGTGMMGFAWLLVASGALLIGCSSDEGGDEAGASGSGGASAGAGMSGGGAMGGGAAGANSGGSGAGNGGASGAGGDTSGGAAGASGVVCGKTTCGPDQYCRAPCSGVGLPMGDPSCSALPVACEGVPSCSCICGPTAHFCTPGAPSVQCGCG